MAAQENSCATKAVMVCSITALICCAAAVRSARAVACPALSWCYLHSLRLPPGLQMWLLFILHKAHLDIWKQPFWQKKSVFKVKV